VSDKIDIVLIASKFCRDWRNRKISHSDYLLATDDSAEPIEEASRLQVDEVFRLLSEFLNLFQEHYFNISSAFAMFESSRGSKSLLRIIDLGLESKKSIIERLRSGEISDSNLLRKDI
jgi:hypothetical protein